MESQNLDMRLFDVIPGVDGVCVRHCSLDMRVKQDKYTPISRSYDTI
jgi:hypothetical protein